MQKTHRRIHETTQFDLAYRTGCTHQRRLADEEIFSKEGLGEWRLSPNHPNSLDYLISLCTRVNNLASLVALFSGEASSYVIGFASLTFCQ
jgi:hypothetical protein